MKKLILCGFLFIAFGKNSFAQQDVVKELSNGEKDSVIFVRVEEEATFPGGVGAWKTFLQKNLNADVPAKNGAPSGIYTIIVRFLVEKDGNISQVVPESSRGYGMEQEVIRIMKKSPAWTPARQNGIIVRAYRRQPITFVVSDK